MAKAVKLADIAERVGVSTVTVSKALSGQKGVSEEVREKIRSIAEELGYQQPSAARKSQNQKSYNIGILISERFLDKYESFYWQMYQAVATRATAKECFTMLEVIGMSEEEVSLILTDSKRVHKHGSGVGLVNVNNRIQILFGKEYGLTVESEPDEGTTVSICMPAVPYTEENSRILEKGYIFSREEMIDRKTQGK